MTRDIQAKESVGILNWHVFLLNNISPTGGKAVVFMSFDFEERVCCVRLQYEQSLCAVVGNLSPPTIHILVGGRIKSPGQGRALREGGLN